MKDCYINYIYYLEPTRGPLLESPDNFSGPESYFVSTWFTLEIQIFVGF